MLATLLIYKMEDAAKEAARKIAEGMKKLLEGAPMVIEGSKAQLNEQRAKLTLEQQIEFDKNPIHEDFKNAEAKLADAMDALKKNNFNTQTK